MRNRLLRILQGFVLVSVSLILADSGLLALLFLPLPFIIAWRVGLLKVVMIFSIPLILILQIAALFTSDSETTSSVEVIEEQIIEESCIAAPKQYLLDINEGMADSLFTVDNAYISNLKDTQISEVRAILPSYTDPIIFAARIKGGDITDDKVVGTWVIQEFDFGKQIRALDGTAKKYSVYGSAASSGSLADKLVSLLSEFSQTTNAKKCALN